jgi:hypothetical protein
MKKISNTLILLIVGSIILQAGCKSGETSSNLANKPASQPSTANSNANQSQPESTASATSAAKPATAGAPPAGPAEPKPAGKAELLGTYESREVQDKGVVTLISQLRTLWLFSPDGTYSRVSEVKGKPYHADSGTFRVEPPDKLILTIQVTGLKMQRKMQNPPLLKIHKFDLSADGEELRLTSEKGSVGIFRRVARPKSQ